MIFAAGISDAIKLVLELRAWSQIAWPGSPIWRVVSDRPRLLPALYFADRDNQSRTPSVEKATLTGSCT